MCEIWSSACTKRNEPFPARAHRLKHGPWLNALWGVALAPPNFGFFSNHLLIGNAGSGQIAVYDVDSGRFDDLPRDANGHAIQNDRLWALRFGNDHAARPSNWLCFTAGRGDEAHGLFGFFTPADTSAPEANGDIVRLRTQRGNDFSPTLRGSTLTCIPLSIRNSALRSR